MNIAGFLFYFFIVSAAASAIAILLIKNVFKAALFLLVCLLSLAAIYILAFAEFVAVTQILIYAGGILVLIIFSIMLTTKISGKPLRTSNTNIVSGISAGIVLLVLLLNYIPGNFMARTTDAMTPSQNIENIGINLMTEYALPFEIAGLLLLVSLLGAAVITSFMKIKRS
jgi:NADH-quinone oxidoreductase subunit J